MLRMKQDVGRNKPAPTGVSGVVSQPSAGYPLAGNARERAYSGLQSLQKKKVAFYEIL